MTAVHALSDRRPARDTFHLFRLCARLPAPAKSAHKALLKELIIRADDEGASWYTLDQLADAIGLGRRRTADVMRDLLSWGYVTNIGRPRAGVAMERRIVAAAIFRACDPTPETRSKGAPQIPPRVVHPTAGGSALQCTPSTRVSQETPLNPPKGTESSGDEDGKETSGLQGKPTEHEGAGEGGKSPNLADITCTGCGFDYPPAACVGDMCGPCDDEAGRKVA